MAKKMLIAEDDRNISELLRLYMEKEGFEVAVAADGRAALAEFKRFRPDIMLLDIMMPIIDGWEVCRQIRAESKTPIIMLTARGETRDKVTGLDLGADDYIPKPFDMKEVIARINAVMRRYGGDDGGVEKKRVCYEKFCVDMISFQLIIDGKPVDAPPKEIELIFFLSSNPNKVFTRDQLLDSVWGFEYYGDTRTVDVHVKRLREKLEGVSEKWTLKTVWGVGYKFEVRNE